jgi:hypothetical protein
MKHEGLLPMTPLVKKRGGIKTAKGIGGVFAGS